VSATRLLVVYLARHPWADNPLNFLAGHRIIGVDARLAGVAGAIWVAEHGEGAEITLRLSEMTEVMDAVVAGAGLGALPCLLGDGEPRLQRLTRETDPKAEQNAEALRKDAEQMDAAEWAAFRDRIATVARLGADEYGLTVGIHAHAAGFIDFEPELERLLDEVDERHLKICFDTGHHSYAGYDPVAFMRRHIGRISYMHFKDIDPKVKAHAIAGSTGFYEACGQGIFCNLGKGDVDFPAVRQILLDAGFAGWCTVEQDCDPTLDVSPIDDARANRDYLLSIGFN